MVELEYEWLLKVLRLAHFLKSDKTSEFYLEGLLGQTENFSVPIVYKYV